MTATTSGSNLGRRGLLAARQSTCSTVVQRAPRSKGAIRYCLVPALCFPPGVPIRRHLTTLRGSQFGRVAFLSQFGRRRDSARGNGNSNLPLRRVRGSRRKRDRMSARFPHSIDDFRQSLAHAIASILIRTIGPAGFSQRGPVEHSAHTPRLARVPARIRGNYLLSCCVGIASPLRAATMGIRIPKVTSKLQRSELRKRDANTRQGLPLLIRLP